ncbi:hypothetical protein HK103_006545 [Boothiomyces macroporosus]|uniref:Uncharacterized protein n=1 Tax=Boothiomyces macroporosus TaxID=261099 RepID=A0AAD5UDE3_9FUNG|nr:hypothetical protein HK103_006545 [Boothiomyces macroporosus]
MIRVFAGELDLPSVLEFLRKIESKTTALYNSIIKAFLGMNDLEKAGYMYSLVENKDLETELLYLQVRVAKLNDDQVIPYVLSEYQNLQSIYGSSSLDNLHETVLRIIARVDTKKGYEFLKSNPSTKMYNILLDYTETDDIPSIIKEMKPDVQTFQIILERYLSLYQQMKKDDFTFYLEKMRQMNIEPNSSIYSMMVQYLIMNETEYLNLTEFLLENEYEIDPKVINLIMMGINKRIFHIIKEYKLKHGSQPTASSLFDIPEIQRLNRIVQSLFTLHSNQKPSSFIYNEMFKFLCFMQKDVKSLMVKMIQMNISIRFNNLYQYCLTRKWNSHLLPWQRNWNNFQVLTQTTKYQLENVPKPLFYIPKHFEHQMLLAMITSYCQNNKRAVKVQNIYGNPTIRDKHLYKIWKCFGWKADIHPDNYGGFTSIILRYCDLFQYFEIKEKILKEIGNK